MHSECLAFGFLLSLIVSALKRIPIVKAYPKVAVAVLSGVVAVASNYFGDGAGATGTFDWVVIAKCALEQFAAGVATHETVTQPVANKMFSGK